MGVLDLNDLNDEKQEALKEIDVKFVDKFGKSCGDLIRELNEIDKYISEYPLIKNELEASRGNWAEITDNAKELKKDFDALNHVVNTLMITSDDLEDKLNSSRAALLKYKIERTEYLRVGGKIKKMKSEYATKATRRITIKAMEVEGWGMEVYLHVISNNK